MVLLLGLSGCGLTNDIKSIKSFTESDQLAGKLDSYEQARLKLLSLEIRELLGDAYGEYTSTKALNDGICNAIMAKIIMSQYDIEPEGDLDESTK